MEPPPPEVNEKSSGIRCLPAICLSVIRIRVKETPAIRENNRKEAALDRSTEKDMQARGINGVPEFPLRLTEKD
jgi:hypothetical protein